VPAVYFASSTTPTTITWMEVRRSGKIVKVTENFQVV
jgi:hypothetical protein